MLVIYKAQRGAFLSVLPEMDVGLASGTHIRSTLKYLSIVRVVEAYLAISAMEVSPSGMPGARALFYCQVRTMTLMLTQNLFFLDFA